MPQMRHDLKGLEVFQHRSAIGRMDAIFRGRFFTVAYFFSLIQHIIAFNDFF